MNLLWDLLSSVIVTIAGCFFFKEEICTTKWVGILLSFVSIYLLG
jgi:multidrug transporter EmrE-like cation transporter